MEQIPAIYDYRVSGQMLIGGGRVYDTGPRRYRDPRQIVVPLGSGAVPRPDIPESGAVLDYRAEDVMTAEPGPLQGYEMMDWGDWSIPPFEGFGYDLASPVFNPISFDSTLQLNAATLNSIAGPDTAAFDEAGETGKRISAPLVPRSQHPRLRGGWWWPFPPADGGGLGHGLIGDGTWIVVARDGFYIAGHAGPGPATHGNPNASGPSWHALANLCVDSKGHVTRMGWSDCLSVAEDDCLVV